MDSSGKIIWAKHSEIQQANIKAMGDQEIKDGERLPLAVKDMGSCEVYPQTIQHNPNGRSEMGVRGGKGWKRREGGGPAGLFCLVSSVECNAGV